MKLTTTLLISFFLFYGITNAQVAVIPVPNNVKYTEGRFNYSKGFDIKISRGDDATKVIQKQLSDFVKAKNISVVPFSTNAVTLNLLSGKTTDISPESYTLTISPAAINISATANAGLFYGVQSLMQILKADSTKSLPCLEIKDSPAFAFRAMHLDVVHHFFGVDVVKQYIDVLSKLKMNQFVWQLTDETTSRIELKAFPGLSKEDHFTQAQIKDIVKYANERYVNIIPEVNLSLVMQEDSSFQAKKAMLDEICQLFPGNYIHLEKDFLFIKETQEYLSAKNKKIIETDNTSFTKPIIQYYKSTKNATKDAKDGSDIIMSPRQYCSLDYYQDWDDEKKSFSMTLLNLEKAYAFNPAGKIKDSATLQHIIGGQACVYTTFIKNTEELQYQVFPRLLALAECFWTRNSNKKFSDFERRCKAKKNYFYIERDEPKIDMVRIKPKKEN